MKDPQFNPKISLGNIPDLRLTPEAESNDLPAVPDDISGVYIATDFQTQQPTGFYRAAINAYEPSVDEYKWVTIGNFKNLDMAAYAFNIHAVLKLGMDAAAPLLNQNVTPDPKELAKWRARTPLNPKRERDAHLAISKYGLEE